MSKAKAKPVPEPTPEPTPEPKHICAQCEQELAEELVQKMGKLFDGYPLGACFDALCEHLATCTIMLSASPYDGQQLIASAIPTLLESVRDGFDAQDELGDADAPAPDDAPEAGPTIN